MDLQSNTAWISLRALPQITPSEDGLVRLSFEELACFPLEHLLSGLDKEQSELVIGAQASEITGYTEWLFERGCAITLGWDWQWLWQDGEMVMQQANLPRSNIQLVEDGYDVSPKRNDQLLIQLIEKHLDWRAKTLDAITQRYQQTG